MDTSHWLPVCGQPALDMSPCFRTWLQSFQPTFPATLQRSDSWSPTRIRKLLEVTTRVCHILELPSFPGWNMHASFCTRTAQISGSRCGLRFSSHPEYSRNKFLTAWRIEAR